MDTIVVGSAANQTAAKYIQTVVDHHSRFAWTFATRVNTADAAVNSLAVLFRTVGKPKRLLTDNGTNFTSTKFRNFLSKHGVRHDQTSPYHPQANGLCERVNGVIAKAIRIRLTESPQLKWSTVLAEATRGYNITPHTITSFTPEFLQFGTACTPADEATDVQQARQTACKKSRAAQDARKRRHDERNSASDFQVGQELLYLVAANHPTKTKFTTPLIRCQVVSKVAPETYIIEFADGSQRRSHSSLLIAYKSRVEGTASANMFENNNGQESEAYCCEKIKEKSENRDFSKIRDVIDGQARNVIYGRPLTNIIYGRTMSRVQVRPQTGAKGQSVVSSQRVKSTCSNCPVSCLLLCAMPPNNAQPALAAEDLWPGHDADPVLVSEADFAEGYARVLASPRPLSHLRPQRHTDGSYFQLGVLSGHPCAFQLFREGVPEARPTSQTFYKVWYDNKLYTRQCDVGIAFMQYAADKLGLN